MSDMSNWYQIVVVFWEGDHWLINPDYRTARISFGSITVSKNGSFTGDLDENSGFGQSKIKGEFLGGSFDFKKTYTDPSKNGASGEIIYSLFTSEIAVPGIDRPTISAGWKGGYVSEGGKSHGHAIAMLYGPGYK